MKTLLESIIVIVPDLQYLRARYYDPNMGRFMQQDTLFGEMERPLTQNLYIYCLNNGVNLRDPSGNSSVAELQAQYDRAQRAGAGQSVLDEIKKAIESKIKAESSSKPKPNPSTKPPKKPDWGDTSNPYNPVNNPNSVGSILSGADGYWGNNGGSSGGGYAPTQEDEEKKNGISDSERRMYELYRTGQLGLMEKSYFEKNLLPKFPKDYRDDVRYINLAIKISKSNKEESEKKFMNNVAPILFNIEYEKDIPVAISFGQLMTESGYGKKPAIDKYDGTMSYNYTGMKAYGDDSYVTSDTPEYEQIMGWYTIEGKFKKYNDFEESMGDYVELLQGRYSKYTTTGTPEDWSNALQKGGYATAPNYGRYVLGISRDWGVY